MPPVVVPEPVVPEPDVVPPVVVPESVVVLLFGVVSVDDVGVVFVELDILFPFYLIAGQSIRLL